MNQTTWPQIYYGHLDHSTAELNGFDRLIIANKEGHSDERFTLHSKAKIEGYLYPGSRCILTSDCRTIHCVIDLIIPISEFDAWNTI